MTTVRSRCHTYSPPLVVAIGLFVVGFSRAESLDEIITRNTEAMGGQQAIEAVQSIAVKLRIVDPGFTAEGIYYAARPGQMRIDIMANGKRVYTEAFDGRRGWQWKGKGEEIADEAPAGTAALRHGVQLPGHLYGLHELQRNGHRLELVGREKIEDTNYYVLRLILDDGYATTLYVDPESWLITRRRDVRALHIDVDPTPTIIEQRISDFRKVSGVMFSFANTETDLQTGKVLETTTVHEITVNPKIDNKMFERL